MEVEPGPVGGPIRRSGPAALEAQSGSGGDCGPVDARRHWFRPPPRATGPSRNASWWKAIVPLSAAADDGRTAATTNAARMAILRMSPPSIGVAAKLRAARAPKRGGPQCCVRAGPNASASVLCDDRRMRPTVLIVDDHDAFRESASALLEAEGFAVVGEAADGDGAIAAAERLRPEVVLLDIQLPGARRLRRGRAAVGRLGPPRVVLISSRDAIAYGARLGTAPRAGLHPERELSGAALAALVG